MRSFADFLVFTDRRSEIWVKEKVQPLKIINVLFIKPNARYYMMLAIIFLMIRCVFYRKTPLVFCGIQDSLDLILESVNQ